MSIQSLLLFMILPFLFLMGTMIGVFLYKTRARQYLRNESNREVADIIQIDCTEKLMAEFAWKTKWQSVVLIGVFLSIYIFIMAMMCLGEGPDFFDLLRDPRSGLHQVALYLALLLAIGGGLGYLSRRDLIINIKNAYQLSLGKKLVLEINTLGFTVPTLLLANPAFWRVGEMGLHEVFIPFSEIETIEVWSKMGHSQAQYKILATGKSAELGLGRLGKIDGPAFGIGIKRHLLLSRENEILKFLQQKLGDHLVIHTT